MEPAATELQQMFGKDVAKRVIRKKIWNTDLIPPTPL